MDMHTTLDGTCYAIVAKLATDSNISLGQATTLLIKEGGKNLDNLQQVSQEDAGIPIEHQELFKSLRSLVYNLDDRLNNLGY